MILQLQIQNKQRKYPVHPYAALVEEAIRETLSGERIYDYLEKNRILPVFSIIFTNNVGIRQLNREFRNLDSSTDVLSFPLLEKTTKIISKASKTDLFLNKKRQRELYFGDIVLSLEKAKEQAVAYGHSMEREVRFLTVHAVLHLLGYDHMNSTDEKAMIRKQKRIMKVMQPKEMESL